jgi:hypothetical protein
MPLPSFGRCMVVKALDIPFQKRTFLIHLVS